MNKLEQGLVTAAGALLKAMKKLNVTVYPYYLGRHDRMLLLKDGQRADVFLDEDGNASLYWNNRKRVGAELTNEAPGWLQDAATVL